MFNLLKKFYTNIENLRGKKLVIVITAVFIVFTFAGILIGYFTHSGLNNDELYDITYNPSIPVEPQKVSYEGKIVYTSPEMYPGEDISYVLVDSSGKDIMLLSAKDKKLVIAEGLYVTVTGKQSATSSGEKLLIVDEVEISK